MKAISPEAANRIFQHLKCPKTGKASYASRGRANSVIRKSKRTQGWENRHGGMPIDVYKCTHCKWWHLTKRKGPANVKEATVSVPDPHPHGRPAAAQAS